MIFSKPSPETSGYPREQKKEANLSFASNHTKRLIQNESKT